MAANPIGPPLLIRQPRAVPAGFPPDVHPREVIASEHINRIRDSVHTWPGDVSAGWHNLTFTGGVLGWAAEGGAVDVSLVRPYAGALLLNGAGTLGRGDFYAYRLFANFYCDAAGVAMINADTATFVGAGGVNTAGGVTAAAWVTSKGTIGATDAGGVAQATLFPDGLIRGRSFQILRAADNALMAGIDTAGNLTAAGINVGGYITSGALILRPSLVGNAAPLQIVNVDNVRVDWLVDGGGTLVTQTNKQIYGIGGLYFALEAQIYSVNRISFAATAQTGGVAIANWGADWLMLGDSATMQIQKGMYGSHFTASVAVTAPTLYVGAVGDTSFSRGGANVITTPSGVLLNAGNFAAYQTSAALPALNLNMVSGGIGIQANGPGGRVFFVQHDGAVFSTNVFLIQAADGSSAPGALNTTGLHLGSGSAVTFSPDNKYYTPPDLEISRFAAGSLWIRNPATGTGAAVNCQVVSASAYVSAEGFRIYSTGATGVGTTFATGDGRTATVVGGIITRIQ